MKKNLSYLTLVCLFFITAHLKAPVETIDPMNKDSAKTESQTQQSNNEQNGKTIAQKSQIVAKALYNAPGKLSKALGGNKDFITGEKGSLKNAFYGSTSSTVKVSEGLNLGENVTSNQAAPSNASLDSKGLDLSSLADKPSKPIAPPKPPKPQIKKAAESLPEPTTAAVKPVKSINLMKENMKSSELLTEDQKLKIDSMSDAQVKEEYDHFQDILSENQKSQQNIQKPTPPAKPVKPTVKAQLNANGTPTGKTILETRDQNNKLISTKIVEKDGTSFSEYLGESKIPSRRIEGGPGNTSTTTIFSKDGSKESITIKDSSGNMISRTTFNRDLGVSIKTMFTNNKPIERITKNNSGEIKGLERFALDGTYRSINALDGKTMETGTYTVDGDGKITTKPSESTSQSTGKAQRYTRQKIKDAYEALGLTNKATPEQVKSAYRKLSLQNHPDKQIGKTPEEINKASLTFEKISTAYKLLETHFQNQAAPYNL